MENENRLRKEEIAVNTEELDEATLQQLVRNNRELQEEISLNEEQQTSHQQMQSDLKDLKPNILTDNTSGRKREKIYSELNEKE